MGYLHCPGGHLERQQCSEIRTPQTEAGKQACRPGSEKGTDLARRCRGDRSCLGLLPVPRAVDIVGGSRIVTSHASKREGGDVTTVLLSKIWSMKGWGDTGHCQILFELPAEARRNERIRGDSRANTGGRSGRRQGRCYPGPRPHGRDAAANGSRHRFPRGPQADHNHDPALPGVEITVPSLK